MNAVPEREVLPRAFAAKINRRRIRPLPRVAIARRPEQHDSGIRRQLLAMELDGHFGLSEVPLKRRLEPQHLLDESGDQLGARAKLFLHVGILRQEAHHASHQAR